jgi:RNA polymerase sigma-70 factor, ECF subfamily
VRRQSTDLTGLTLLRALIAREQLALVGGGLFPHSSGAGSVIAAGRLAMAVGTKPSPTPAQGKGGPSYTSDDPEQERIAALVTLAQQGDGEAFGQIYDKYVDAVYRYLYYRVGSPQLAEDLTSETFVRALRRIDSFHWQGKDIGAWFVTIARNLVADHFKSSRFKLEMSTGDILDADHSGSVNQGNISPGTEQIVLDRLRDAELLGAVKELKPDQQECVVLRFLQGLSVAETADVMGRSQGAIKQLQLRAVRSLAKVLVEPST